MTATEHPSWCEPALCTAPAGQPGKFDPHAGWHHTSAPVPLKMRITGTAVVPDAGGGDIIAQLYQAVAPLRCETFLWISDGRPDGYHLEFPLHQALETAATLGLLLADAADDRAATAARDLASLSGGEQK
jgi:hypothetical protein